MDAGPPPDAGPLVIPGLRLTALFDAGPMPTVDAGSPDGGMADGGASDSGQPEPARPAPDLTAPDASIPDVAALLFEAAAPLEDARFRLFTDGDRLVANHADISITDGGTRVLLSPAPFWPAQGCCRFQVDGETEVFPTGGGSRYRKFEASFGIEADPHRLQAAIASKQHQKQKHHRRR